MRLTASILSIVLAALSAGVARAAEPTLVAEFDIPSNGDPILVPLEFQGKTYAFLFDTGTSYTTFDITFQPLLGEPKSITRIPAPLSEDRQEKQIGMYYAPDASLGGISLRRGGPVMCVSLEKFRRVSGLEVHGVIGAALMQRFIVQFDFDAGKLRFLESDDGPHPDWGEQVRMRTNNRGIGYVLGMVYGELHSPFAIDTGFAGTGTVSKRVYDGLELRQKIDKTIETNIATAGGTITSQVFRMEQFELGEMDYQGLIFDKAEGENRLGLGFLSRHLATLDFANARLFLKPGRRFETSDDTDMSGLHLILEDGQVVIHSVDDPSPAKTNLLEAGDILLRLNEQPVEEMSLIQIRKLLHSEPGKTIEVIFQRGDKLFKTSFMLKRRI
jgi:predicted aspartyl protease